MPTDMNAPALIGVLAFVSFLHFGFTTNCHYPTFYDSDNGTCVMTCPNGTYGVVNGASDDGFMNYTRNCTTIPTGYFTIFNATHYEFDVNVYCPIGTVVFEGCILVEDPNTVQLCRPRRI
ncbi:uncharacterized protein [Dysidea avara]|uniref:uncharacterized protein n=1 Tax=Dysidea avara TaxID=196820 RepID=UPI003328F771